MSGLSAIDHIVILMLENRSFDHMLGYLRKEGCRKDVDGLSGEESNMLGGTPIPSWHMDDPRFPADPPHEGRDVRQQLANANSGFVQCYMDANRGMTDVKKLSAVMGYYNATDLPVYDFLAEQYTICDRWFSSVAGPTIPNRLYAMAGTSGGLSSSPHGVPTYPFDTVFDRLTAAKKSWHVFAGNHLLSMLRLFKKYQLSAHCISNLNEFTERCKHGTLPSVSWVEPNYGIFSNYENDDHPPTHIGHAQHFVATIYNQLVNQGNSAWNRTLFIVTYDEHGGIYDHVTPPAATDDLDLLMPTLGVRVPAFVISPFAKKRFCSSEHFDHTSIIKTILERFTPNADGSVPSFNKRVDSAKSLKTLLTDSPRTDTTVVPEPAEPLEEYPAEPNPLRGEAPSWAAPPMPNEYQKTLAEVAKHIITVGLER